MKFIGTVTSSLAYETKDELSQWAHIHGITVSETVRRLIYEFLDQTVTEKIRRIKVGAEHSSGRKPKKSGPRFRGGNDG